MPQMAPSAIRPTSTSTVFRAGGVELVLEFRQPKLIAELDSYVPTVLVRFNATALDGRPHAVQVFFEVTGQTVVNTDTERVLAGREMLPSGAVAMSLGHAVAGPAGVPIPAPAFASEPKTPWQPVEHLNWGAGHLAIPKSQYVATRLF